MSTVEHSVAPSRRLTEIPLRLTYEEYLAWDELEGGLTEWVHGEVEFHMPPLPIHQRVFALLFKLMSLFVDGNALGEVCAAPWAMRVTPDSPAREPDIFFLAAAHAERMTNKALEGPADLVIEIISEESAYRDREIKFFEYQDGGVREYWIIDPRPGKHRIEGYQLDLDGTYLPISPDADRRYHSLVLPGFWFRPAWLWQEPPTDPLMALVEMRGLAPEAIQMIRALLKGEAS